MKIYSIFNSIDGEINSFHQGCFTTFIRMAGCNFYEKGGCIYCDTQYATPPESGIFLSTDEIIRKVNDIGCNKITITGGEPLTQFKDVKDLIFKLKELKYNISVETNGSIFVPTRWPVDCWIVDYKLSGSGMKDFMNEDFFLLLRGNDFIKFVISSFEDYQEAIKVMRSMKKYSCLAKFAYSPVFGTISGPELIEWMKKDKLFDCIVNLQLHKLISLREDI